ncbi:MAG: hypothetical protein AB7G28_02305 [Pirellulales bacterium]
MATKHFDLEALMCVNDVPLSECQRRLFDGIWSWFAQNKVTAMGEPYVVSSQHGSGHYEGKIEIDERDAKPTFPLGAIMLEEILHYVTSTDRSETSADFSAEYLQFILQQIVERLDARHVYEEKRAFQSVLIRELWQIIEKDRQERSADAIKPDATMSLTTPISSTY